jgi:putative ABC transport system permease protein
MKIDKTRSKSILKTKPKTVFKARAESSSENRPKNESECRSEIESQSRSKTGSEARFKSELNNESSVNQKTGSHPPWIFRLLLKALLTPPEYLEFTDDMNEIYPALAESDGLTKARIWYAFRVLESLPSFISDLFYWRIIMLRNYLKTTLRNLKRQKTQSTINILGLAIGLTCCILIILFVRDELSFDKFHENHDRIYRVTRRWLNEDGAVSLHLGFVAPPIGPLLKNDFPAIEHAVRMVGTGGMLVSHGDAYFEENLFFFAEENLFDVFSIKMTKGDPSTSLVDPLTIVISEEMARKYFGSEDPIGQTIHVEAQGQAADLKVTGVIEPLPHNSHFHADFFASFKTYEAIVGDDEMQSWSSNNYATYILIRKNHDVNILKEQLNPFIDRHMDEGRSKITQLILQPLTDIHLHSHLDSELESNSDISYVYVFSVIAFFVLMIAAINFMNLSTARSSQRAKEVGLRKVVGANRSQLIKQFLSESLLTVFAGLAVALILVKLLLPRFNQFLSRELSFNLSGNIGLLSGLIFVAVLVGIVSGLYPAVFLSSFQPATVLKGAKDQRRRKLSLRTVLVVFQFAISIVLIICVGVVTSQLRYIRNINLGFNEEQVVVLPSSSRISSQLESVKTQLYENPNIISVSAAKRVPSGRLLDSSGASVIRGEKSEPINFMIALLRVDHDYIPTFGMELAAGRNFSKEMPTDAANAFILNETAIRQIGWESPLDAIGKGFVYGRAEGQIIGVVKDFHFESIHHKIAPIVMVLSAHSLNQVAVRISPNDIPGTMAFLQGKWQEFRPNYPFSYYFVDERFDQQYRSENKLLQLFGYFAFLAIFIACLGLFGLALYTAEQSIKEIGIRKVLGASVSSLVFLFSKEFSKWVLLANIIGWPVAYYAMTKWLANFAYRTSLSLWIFLLAGVLALVIALITVSFHSVKAAIADPVTALRYE